MPLQSKTSVRVTGIPGHTTREEYHKFVIHLSTPPPQNWRRFSFLKSSKAENVPVAGQRRWGSNATACLIPAADRPELAQETAETFAVQNGVPVGTISFASSKLKDEAIQRHNKDCMSEWKAWVLKDSFEYLTILYDYGDEAEVDICAVHGLGGNAMDTWTADNNKMWLRDFLPRSDHFEKSRIMTFGYDSDLADRRSTMMLEDWAETLLHSVSDARTLDKERSRPIIFMCHSLGGLVGRKAMIQLPNADFQGIKLGQCGLLFLSTPHSGTTKADWNGFLVAVVETVAGVRRETLDRLKSFNPASGRDQRDFLNLKPTPPFRCLVEGDKTRIGRTNQYVVTKSSASLDPQNPARPVMNADHRTICKFDSNTGTFPIVNSELCKVFAAVEKRDTESARQSDHIPGHPGFIAHAYPPHRQHWWEGNEMGEINDRVSCQTSCMGRNQELGLLESYVAIPEPGLKLTAVKGIGGIGKTEILSQFVAKQKGVRNVFFLQATNSKNFIDAVNDIAMNVGFDMIENPSLNREIWRTTSSIKRVEIFVNWLGHSCNNEAVLVVDDLDAFDPADIDKTLKCPVRHVVVSTRDSDLRWTKRHFKEIRIPQLDHESVISIMKGMLKSDELEIFAPDGLESIARVINGHPLAARLVMPFIHGRLATYDNPAEAFVRFFESSDYEERKTFWDFESDGLSLWKSFELSYTRLQRRDRGGSASMLMGLLPFLKTDSDCIDNFFKQMPWSEELDKGELPDASIFRSRYLDLAAWLGELRKVSLYVSKSSTNSERSLNFHPLTLQFALLRAGPQGRLRLMRQILILCYQLANRGEVGKELARPHVEHCLRICHELSSHPSTLGLPSDVLRWLESASSPELEGPELEEDPELLQDPFADPVHDPMIQEFITRSAEAREAFEQPENALLSLEARNAETVRLLQLRENLEKYLQESSGKLPECSITALEDAVSDLIVIVRRSTEDGRNIYPELLPKLEKFKRGLQTSSLSC